MKKNVSSIIVFVLALVFIFHFTGCEKLKVSNLEANYHLKKANKLYKDEQYRNAIKDYEKALELNPGLKLAYIYLGTSYSQIYRPMKEDDRNKEIGVKAEEYLKLAQEYDPENEKVVIALGDLYDKMGNFEEAEKYYLMIKERAADDPKTYYTLANFYQNNGKIEQAEQMYLQRIELNPEDPEGYHYFVRFLNDQRRWEELIFVHKKRMYATLDSSIILTLREIDKLRKDAEQIEKTTEYMEMIKKNKKVDAQEKQRLLDEAQQNLEGKLSLEDTNKKVEELTAQSKEQIDRALKTIDAQDDETKLKITEIYYAIGNVCWNWSYQTPPDFMSPEERKPIITEGIDSLQTAIDIKSDYAFAYSYMGLLYREMIKVNPLKRAEYIAKNEEWNKKFQEVYQKKQKAEAFRKELEQMGEKVEDGGEGN